MRHGVLPALQAHEFEEFYRAVMGGLTGRRRADFERKAYILKHRSPWQQCRILENEANLPIPPGLGRRPPKNTDRSGLWLKQTRDHA
ncbi:hypothetical protein GCM10023157_36250 [Gluconacetobacter asukensis]